MVEKHIGGPPYDLYPLLKILTNIIILVNRTTRRVNFEELAPDDVALQGAPAML
jgi:hypothetical protein